MEERKQSNSLVWMATKVVNIKGDSVKLNVKVKLDDDYKNGVCDFSITYWNYIKASNGRYVEHDGGACGDRYNKYFGELEQFGNLHLSNSLGQPMYAIDNTMYILASQGIEKGMEYARITEEEAKALELAARSKDKVFFKSQLFQLRIIDRWKKEAEEFIHWLEEKTGTTWIDPYTDENRKFSVQPLTQEELDHIATVNWTEEAILEAERKRIEEEKQEALLKLKEKFENDLWHLKKEYEIRTYLLKQGYQYVNMIYYQHKKTVKFNWVSWKPAFTIDDYNRLLEDVNKPDGVDYVWEEPKRK